MEEYSGFDVDAGQPLVGLDCAGLLLAGGKSARMGRDKSLFLIGGVPLWFHQMEVLGRSGVAELMVAGPASGPWARDARWTVVEDSAVGAGPLAGIAGAFDRQMRRWLLVLAVDLPLMEARFLRRMLRFVGLSGKGCVPFWGDLAEPLAAVYPIRMAALARQRLARGEFSLRGWVDEGMGLGVLERMNISPGDRPLFHNLNTPGDCVRAGIE